MPVVQYIFERIMGEISMFLETPYGKSGKSVIKKLLILVSKIFETFSKNIYFWQHIFISMELGELGSVRVVVAIYLTLNSFLTRGLLTKFSDKECKHKS